MKTKVKRDGTVEMDGTKIGTVEKRELQTTHTSGMIAVGFSYESRWFATLVDGTKLSGYSGSSARKHAVETLVDAATKIGVEKAEAAAKKAAEVATERDLIWAKKAKAMTEAVRVVLVHAKKIEGVNLRNLETLQSVYDSGDEGDIIGCFVVSFRRELGASVELWLRTEHFGSEDLKVAVNWPGIRSSSPKSTREFSDLLADVVYLAEVVETMALKAVRVSNQGETR